MSGNRKQDQAKPDCGDAAKATSNNHRETTVTAPVLDSTPHFTGAADKAVNLVGCKSPHHQLPERVVSISDACGGNEACSART